MHIPVHSPWVPGYIHVMQTDLIMLIVAGYFPDKPHIYKFVHVAYDAIIYTIRSEIDENMA